MTSTLDISTGLLTATGPDVRAHLERHGSPPLRGPARPGTLGPLATEITAAGLRGRGGGWFPTGRKLAAVAAATGTRPPVVVVNAMEGEPLSAKDAHLLAVAPHLVLDGASLVAETLGADRVIVAVPAGGAGPALRRMAAERIDRDVDPFRADVVEGPERFLSGQETALVNWLGGGRPVPTARRPFERGVDGRATLLSNAETFAHVALIARFGVSWFRSAGTAEAPGTMLVSVSDPKTRVLEVPVGTPVGELIGSARAVLFGGYGGAWLPGEKARGTPLAPEPLRAAGAAIGAGIIAPLPYGDCGIRRTAAIAAWMAGQGARQCGPCLFGLPSVADDLYDLAAGRAGRADVDRLRARVGLLRGRGGCAHPDGVFRLVDSALRVFADEVEAHLDGRCGHSTYRRGH